MAFTGASSTGEGLRKLADQFKPALAVVTLGERGSLARCDGREISTPALPVTVVDPTGAGDAFRGGFIAGWLRHGDGAAVDTLLQYANDVAGCNCRALGAQAGLPTQEELDRVTGELRGRSN
jgi:2-dehydro-3-deoxygluconokinase